MKILKRYNAIGRAAGSCAVSIIATALMSGLMSSGAAAAPKSKPVAEPVRAPQGPLVVVVSIGSQRMVVYDKQGRVLESGVSSGRSGYETPKGVFAVIERNKEHFSNLYNDAPMPNMHRITWSGVALHAGNLPGYPASHGCIRLPYNVSERLFGMSKLGMRVVVADDDAAPVAIEHGKLFSSYGEDQPVKVAEAMPLTPAVATGPMPAPMRLGAMVIDAPATPGLPPLVNPFEKRPAGVSRQAWAAELSSKAQAEETRAKALKTQAALAAKDATRTGGQMKALERNRRGIAARIEELGKRIAAPQVGPSTLTRLTNELDAVAKRLAVVQADIEKLQPAEAEKRALAERLAGESSALDKARVASADLAREANRLLKPVSVFVSRKTGRLYVRQGFQPVFDVPVAIADPQKPIGTHTFTALDHKPGSDAMAWSVITSVGDSGAVAAVSPKRRKGNAEAPVRPRLTAAAALDRLDIPQDVRQRIGVMMIPGSSLIVSDEAISGETGKGTDFVILTR